MLNRYSLDLDEVRHPSLVLEESFHDDSILDSPRMISDVFKKFFRLQNRAEEYTYLLCTDTKCKPVGVFEVSHGGINTCPVGCREIFIRALLCGAAMIVLIHNHPSGDPTPSVSDDDICKRILYECEFMEIPLMDFLILGKDNYYSYRENGHII